MRREELVDNYYMVKEAVNLNQLNRAYRKVVAPRIFNATAEEVKATRDLYKKLVEAGAPESLTRNFRQQRIGMAYSRDMVEGLSTPGAIKKRFTPMIQPYLAPDEVERVIKATETQAARMREFSRRGKKRRISAIINMPPDQTRALGEELGLVSPFMTDRGKEMVHNALGLHEAREIRALYKSKSRKLGLGPGPTFESHIGPDPMLNDVIIANTLTGEGAKGAKDLLMKMRAPELKRLKNQLAGDARAEALIDKLLAGGRINRHGRKYLDRVHAERLGRMSETKRALSQAPKYKTTQRTERAKKISDKIMSQQSSPQPKRGLLSRLKSRFSRS